HREIHEFLAVNPAYPMRHTSRNVDQIALGDAARNTPGDCTPPNLTWFRVLGINERATGHERPAAVDHIPNIREGRLHFCAPPRLGAPCDQRTIVGVTKIVDPGPAYRLRLCFLDL